MFLIKELISYVCESIEANAKYYLSAWLYPNDSVLMDLDELTNDDSNDDSNDDLNVDLNGESANDDSNVELTNNNSTSYLTALASYNDYNLSNKRITPHDHFMLLMDVVNNMNLHYMNCIPTYVISVIRIKSYKKLSNSCSRNKVVCKSVIRKAINYTMAYADEPIVVYWVNSDIVFVMKTEDPNASRAVGEIFNNRLQYESMAFNQNDLINVETIKTTKSDDVALVIKAYSLKNYLKPYKYQVRKGNKKTIVVMTYDMLFIRENKGNYQTNAIERHKLWEFSVNFIHDYVLANLCIRDKTNLINNICPTTDIDRSFM